MARENHNLNLQENIIDDNYVNKKKADKEWNAPNFLPNPKTILKSRFI